VSLTQHPTNSRWNEDLNEAIKVLVVDYVKMLQIFKNIFCKSNWKMGKIKKNYVSKEALIRNIFMTYEPLHSH
jgi:predicted glycosyltransferase involved in capsule biosynthesis